MNANQNRNKETIWDREHIKSELRREGYSLARLDRMHNKSSGYFSQALTQPMPNAERVIADILGVEPHTIWPVRYGSDGRPHQGRFLPRNDALAKQAARQVLKQTIKDVS